MITNQILQSTIDGLEAITRVSFCVCSIDGMILASNLEGAEGMEGMMTDFGESAADSQTIGGCHFFKVFDEHQLQYILLAKGDDDKSLWPERSRSSRSSPCWSLTKSVMIRITSSRTF